MCCPLSYDDDDDHNRESCRLFDDDDSDERDNCPIFDEDDDDI